MERVNYTGNVKPNGNIWWNQARIYVFKANNGNTTSSEVGWLSSRVVFVLDLWLRFQNNFFQKNPRFNFLIWINYRKLFVFSMVFRNWLTKWDYLLLSKWQICDPIFPRKIFQLRLLATGEMFQSLMNQFCVHRVSISKFITEVCKVF